MALSSTGSTAAEAAQGARSGTAAADRGGRARGSDFAALLEGRSDPPPAHAAPATPTRDALPSKAGPAHPAAQAATSRPTDATPTGQAAARAATDTADAPAAAQSTDTSTPGSTATDAKGKAKDTSKGLAPNSAATTGESPDAIAAQQAVLAQLLAAGQVPAATTPVVAQTPSGDALGAAVGTQAQSMLAAVTDAQTAPSSGTAPATGAPGSTAPAPAAAAPTARDGVSLALFGTGASAQQDAAGGSSPGQQGAAGQDSKGGLLDVFKQLPVAAAAIGGDTSGFTPLMATQLTAAANAVAANAAAASAAPGAGAASDPAVAPRLHETVGSERWANELGSRLTVMAAQGDQSGSLRLSPEHLGPLEVQIKVSDNKASVWFGAQHADTRSALQDALPKLREMFAASGMQLGDAGVSRQAPRQSPTPSAPLSGSPLRSADSGEESISSVAAVSSRHLGLLDTYA